MLRQIEQVLSDIGIRYHPERVMFSTTIALFSHTRRGICLSLSLELSVSVPAYLLYALCSLLEDPASSAG
ncbi:hypothetical protein CWB98_00380 [Pseudoalteromonas rubra]|uniref:Uncharacterized protein n=1 Tax=Pseudoalteromonas rubra TaxID=43658 RepID=A0A5S3X5G5_9GAMM|nr:hypothetical protein CWB98_00380 [Pseudoalteromonas rubra]